jgi:hypothetical protein
MNRLSMIIGVGAPLLFAFASTAEAGSIWQWTHQASGGGTANLFDGGSTLSASDETTGLDDRTMAFSAVDDTHPGPSAAEAVATGRSGILGAQGHTFFGVQSILTTSYSPPRIPPGGADPGGEAAGSLSSVVEFVAPVDDLAWSYFLDIDTDPLGAFTGSVDVMLENLTQSTVLQIPSEDTLFRFVEFDFDADAGDLIRLTTEMAGSGSTGPETPRFFNANFRLSVVAPEPGMLSLLLAGVPLTRRRRRASAVPIRLAAPVIGGVA